MHIEPGLVDTTKIFLSYAAATAALGYSAKLAWDMVRQEGAAALLARSVIAAVLVFVFFELLPTQPVGISEVHLILGSTLLLVLGAAPAAIGLAVGLAIQSVFFAPDELVQYGMNVTTLLVPLFALQALARRVIAPNTAYVDIGYTQALKLSLTYQGGIVVWVGFWALYGQGFGAENLSNIGTFGAAYMSVVLLEPMVGLAVLALAKRLHRLKGSPVVGPRLFNAA
jgi:ABC-type Co2+ transport system permease subunit